MTKFLSIRIDTEIRDKFNIFCKENEMTMSKAICILAECFTESGTLPFELDDCRRTGVDRKDTRIGVSMPVELRKRFKDACEEYDMPMGAIVRSFMANCIAHDKFPYDVNYWKEQIVRQKREMKQSTDTDVEE
jgi:antitoxin component of RelBE/YafQ-DinJ toxin-antitoxin module